jgi:Flp pilus assembly protein TadG
MGGQPFGVTSRDKRTRLHSIRSGGVLRGQMILIVASAVVALLGFAAIATDVGLMWNTRRQMQTAADSAAIAGEQELVAPNTTATIADAADQDSASNGFTNGVNGASVVVNNPPLHGAYTGNTNAVEVIVSQSQPTYFLRALGLTTVPVLARAVGVPGSGTGCIFSMDPSASNSLVASGSASISAQCGIWVNSSSTSGMVASGSACIQGGSINIVASGYSNHSSCAPSPTPSTGLQAISDPLAYVPAPSTAGSCAHTNYSITSTPPPAPYPREFIAAASQ